VSENFGFWMNKLYANLEFGRLWILSANQYFF